MAGPQRGGTWKLDRGAFAEASRKRSIVSHDECPLPGHCMFLVSKDMNHRIVIINLINFIVKQAKDPLRMAG